MAARFVSFTRLLATLFPFMSRFRISGEESVEELSLSSLSDKSYFDFPFSCMTELEKHLHMLFQYLPWTTILH